MFDGDEATARQQYPEGEPEEVSAEEELLGTSMDDAIADLFPDTPAPEKPAPKPQAHRARITGVTLESNAEGTKWLKFSYQSLENGSDDALTVFPPVAYVNNPMVDPATLSTETPINPETGRPRMSERQKYAQSVRNSGKTKTDGTKIPGDGTIETIMRFAKEQGHAVPLAQTPRTFEKVAEYLNALCTGTEVVALLRAQGGDGEFSDRLRTSRFVDFTYADQPKSLKGYVKLWQVSA